MGRANTVCLLLGGLVGAVVYEWAANSGGGQGAYLAAALWGLIGFMLTRTIYAARESIAHALSLIVVAALIGVIIYGVIAANRHGDVELARAKVIGAFAGVLYLTFGPKRSRRIPARVRRAAIARDLRGAKFDPSRHHIDHIQPFSRGGSHTEDNLRVVDKRKNLRKGARKPKPWDWFFR